LFGLEIIVIFVIIWWLVLFIILPLGVQTDDNVVDGNDPGAPKNPMLKKKIIITSIISFFLSIFVSVVKDAIF
tara:strand:- start:1079 stop:1297 length:219 start_codon:yes stop_codon:yes gene_type:complete